MYRRTNLLFRVVDALFRNRNLFLISILAVAIPVTLLLIVKNKGYSAKGAIQISKAGEAVNDLVNVKNPFVSGSSWDSPAKQNVESFNNAMLDTKRGGFVEKLLEKAELSTPISLDPNANDKRLGDLLRGLTIHEESSNLFSVSLNWPNQVECAKLVDGARKAYVEYKTERQVKTSTTAAQLLEQQIATTQKQVQAASEALRSYEEAHPDAQPEQVKYYSEELNRLRDDLNKSKTALQGSIARKLSLEQNLAGVSRMVVSERSSGPAAPVEESAASKTLRDLEQQRSQLLTGAGAFSPTSDTVKGIDRQIAEARKAASRERRSSGGGGTKMEPNPTYVKLQGDVMEAGSAIEASRSHIAELQQQIAAASAKLKTTPGVAHDLALRRDELKKAEDQLSDLRTQLITAKRMNAVSSADASQTLEPLGDVVAESLAGTKKKVIFIIASVFMGLIAAGLMVALREWSDATIRYESDIESILDVPVLTGLPENRAVLTSRKRTDTRKAVPSRAPRALPSHDDEF